MQAYIESTATKVTPAELNQVVEALNNQMTEVYTYHGVYVQVKVKQPTDTIERASSVVLYLQDKLDIEGALGYHDKNNKGIPYGVISTELSALVGEPWSTTMSHELIELALDQEANLVVLGPHPTDPNLTVCHWYEGCDACQDQSYKIGNVWVSNFLLPLYFVPDGNKIGFTNRMHNLLKSFNVTPGGYIGFYNPSTGKVEQYVPSQGARSKMALKAKMGDARRFLRYAKHFPVRKSWWGKLWTSQS